MRIKTILTTQATGFLFKVKTTNNKQKEVASPHKLIFETL
jgi:hypothetical protein